MRKFILKIVVCITLLICCLPTTIKAGPDDEAKIDDVYYATLELAMSAAQDGDTIIVLKDVTIENVISIANKNLTLKGLIGDEIITYDKGEFSMDCSINVHFQDDQDHTVVIKDLTIVAGAANYGIYVTGRNGNLTLDNVKVTASIDSANPGSALHFEQNSRDLIVDISDCYFKGVSGIFIMGSYLTINIDETTILSTVNSVTTDQGAIVLEHEPNVTWGAAYTQVTITDSNIKTGDADYYAIIDKAPGSLVIFDEPTASNLVGKIYTVVAVDSDNNMYESLQQAIDDNIDNDKAVILYKDINLNDTINIEGEITIKSYNKNTLTSSADPAINIKTPGPVTIEYLKIENVSGNAVNISDTVENTELNIDQCDLTGYSALAVYGKGATVNVNVSNLTGVNDKEYGDGSNNHSTIFVANKNVSITVNNFPVGKVIAESTEGKAKQWIAGADPGSSEGLQLYINSEFETNGSAAIYGFDPEEGLNVKVRKQYANQLKSEGFRVSAPDANNMITVLGFLPPTGDDINISIWISIMLVSVVGILGAIVYGKKKELI